MAPNYRAWSFRYYGTAPIAPYQAVSLADASEVSTANAAGIPGGVGDIVVVTPVGSGVPTRKVVGVTVGPSNPLTGEVTVAIGGIARAMVNAAISAANVAAGAHIFPAATGTRTSVQTPFTNNLSLLLPTPPEFTRTYQLGLMDDTAIVAASTGANAVFYPLGYALTPAAAQYDVILVDINTGVFYA